MHWLAWQWQPEPALSPEPTVPEAEAGPAWVDGAKALGWWALQFTPRVAWVNARESEAGQTGDTLLMEVSGSERLFGGRRALLHRLQHQNKPAALIKHAQGATSLIAIARLHPHSREARCADDLPLTALAAASSHLATLQTLGCTHWGQLRALPRAGVARRFGAALIDALDRAYGQATEHYPWLVLPDVFAARLDLAARVASAPALMFAARRLLSQLQLWLQMRQRGILGLELSWTLDGARLRSDAVSAPQAATRLLIHTAEPTRNVTHLQRLLAEHLAHVRLAAPVEALTLRSLETAPLPGASASLLPDEVRQGDSLPHLLERLSARLGPQAVLRAVPQADHRPERMQVWQPATQTATPTRPSVAPKKRAETPLKIRDSSPFDNENPANGAFYPTWLLAEPQPLEVRQQQPHYHGALTLLAGPQRIETGWWANHTATAAPQPAGPILRDYFIARNPRAHLLWIYRDRLNNDPGTARWYLHGLFS